VLSPPVEDAAGAPSVEAPAPLQKEIVASIESQVTTLLEKARIETESKVKMELKTIRDQLFAIDANLDQMIEQLDGLEPLAPDGVEQCMGTDEVGQLLSKIEQQWGQEIRTLKQELHQTILAHNHNADLIKHHKDMIDQLRDDVTRNQECGSKAGEFQSQLQNLDQRIKQQQKQRKMEPLFERLVELEQRVSVAIASRAGLAAAWGAYPPTVPPGMGFPMGMPPIMSGVGKTGGVMSGMKNPRSAAKIAATAAAANAIAVNVDTAVSESD
jgi:hypothetical protein